MISLKLDSLNYIFVARVFFWSIFDRFDVIRTESYRIRWNNVK